MQPLTRLLLRNQERLARSGRKLWVNPPTDLPWREFVGDPDDAVFFCQDFGAWARLVRDGAPTRFGSFPDAKAPRWRHIVLCQPREKSRLEMMLACLVPLLETGGQLWLVGEIRTGIKSASKRLADHFDQVAKADSARHCVLYAASSARAAERFDPARYARDWIFDSPAGELKLRSWPGVFAHGGLDEGTRRLIDALPELPAGARVLDFGCGCGVIGCYLLRREPSLELVFLDNNALACRAAEASLSLNGFEGKVLAGDGLGGLEGRFDFIVTNPPFHAGRRSDTGLTPRLLDPARNFLRPGGQLYMVVNRHLPYGQWLKETFPQTDTLAEDGRFRVLACHV